MERTNLGSCCLVHRPNPPSHPTTPTSHIPTPSPYKPDAGSGVSARPSAGKTRTVCGFRGFDSTGMLIRVVTFCGVEWSEGVEERSTAGKEGSTTEYRHSVTPTALCSGPRSADGHRFTLDEMVGFVCCASGRLPLLAEGSLWFGHICMDWDWNGYGYGYGYGCIWIRLMI